MPSFCCVPSNPVALEGGAPGGAGGTGGVGGLGGGGAGGWSCAYTSVQDASVTWNGTRLLVGEAGAGGPPNGVGGWLRSDVRDATRSRLAVGALGIAAATLGVAACAAIAGIDDPRSRAEDASVGSLEAAPEGSDSATNDGGVRPPAPDGALPDSGVTASSCGARVVDDVNGVFVAPGGADDLACGTRQLPCRSLQMGLTQANTLGKSIVYAASGTYVESVSLAGGLSMEAPGASMGPRGARAAISTREARRSSRRLQDRT